MVEDDELPGATQLRVVVNDVSQGKGQKRRTRFMCSVTMHDAQRRKIDGYKRCQSIRRSDPRGSEDEKQSVRQLSMAKFGAQKRERMEDNLFNSDDDDDDRVATGACHSLPAAPCPNSCPDPPCSCPLFAICLLLLLFHSCRWPAEDQAHGESD